VEELGGLVWAYLGPEPAPLLPHFDLFVWDHCLRDIGQATLPCHWLQIMENSVDPHHVEALHGHHLRAVRSRQGLNPPSHYLRRHRRVAFDRFEFGILKRRQLEGQPDDCDDWTIGHPLIFPHMLRVGSGTQHRMQIRVPVDETTTWHLWYSCYQYQQENNVCKQQEIPIYDVPWLDENGRHIMDTVDGQDIMTWVTQGPVADRTREILGTSDHGIVELRKLLSEQMELIATGEDPIGLVRDPARNLCIRLPQEREKYGSGKEFLAESITMGHARYSPLLPEILNLLGSDPGG
jgi:5,5'-dehydrodivanillate O-demethylase